MLRFFFILMLLSACKPEETEFPIDKNFIKENKLDGIWGDEYGQNFLILNSEESLPRAYFKGEPRQYTTNPLNIINNRNNHRTTFLWLNQDKLHYVYYEDSLSPIHIGQLYKYNLEYKRNTVNFSFDSVPHASYNNWESRFDSVFKTPNKHWEAEINSKILRFYTVENGLIYIYSLVPNTPKPCLGKYDYLYFNASQDILLDRNYREQLIQIEKNFILSIFNKEGEAKHLWITAFDQPEEKVQILGAQGQLEDIVFRQVSDTLFDMGVELIYSSDTSKIIRSDYYNRAINSKYKYVSGF